MRLIDANGSYTLNASDNTDHSICFGGGIISVMDERGHCICEFDAEDAPTADAVEWIPVTERLPAKNANGTADAVLVTNGWVQHMAYFINGDWLFAESGEAKEPMFYVVTHWMPLPEPPKEVPVDA